jgi:hypothetical protein
MKPVRRALHTSFIFPASCIIRAVLMFLLWIALLTAAGLCYPRWPRTSAVLFLVLGVLSVVLIFLGNSGNGLIVGPGLFWIGLGVWYLVKFRSPDARAKHVEYWTAKA